MPRPLPPAHVRRKGNSQLPLETDPYLFQTAEFRGHVVALHPANGAGNWQVHWALYDHGNFDRAGHAPHEELKWAVARQVRHAAERGLPLLFVVERLDTPRYRFIMKETLLAADEVKSQYLRKAAPVSRLLKIPKRAIHVAMGRRAHADYLKTRMGVPLGPLPKPLVKAMAIGQLVSTSELAVQAVPEGAREYDPDGPRRLW